MTVNKRGKLSRYRGSHTHGCGSKKKRRGAGNRGGKGMAGTGKRADQKKPTILKLYGNEYFGKRGFHRPQKMIKKVKAINIKDLQKKLNFYLESKLISKEKDMYIVNLSKLGYQKLLGTGELSVKLKLDAEHISNSASKKIQEKGGVIINKDEGSSN
ncbi:uL15 family ribosomal protein [Candidatus Woesearchaeota archaeon]|nr:uL15 family ribosomal protein [Candidatus Woesearchaeota archaeon]